MKKVIINICLVLTFFILYFLQANFFSWFNIAGVMPNVFVIFALFIGLFTNRTIGTAYGVGIGLLLDFIIGTKIGIYAVTLGTIGFLAALFDKNFSKDSRMTIMCMVSVASILAEIIAYIINQILQNANAEIYNFIKIVLIETIFNVIITIVIYPIFQKAGYYIENEYKQNQILTRYF